MHRHVGVAADACTVLHVCAGAGADASVNASAGASASAGAGTGVVASAL